MEWTWELREAKTLVQVHTARKQPGALKLGPRWQPLVSSWALCTKAVRRCVDHMPASHPQADLEIQKDALEPGQKVVVVDDLLATGGEGFPKFVGVEVPCCM